MNDNVYNYAVSMFHEQAALAATSIPITSVVRHFPRSVLSQEQREDYRPLPVSHFFKEDKAYLVRHLFYLCTTYMEIHTCLFMFVFWSLCWCLFRNICAQLLTWLQGATDKQMTENVASLHEEKVFNNFGQLGFKQQLLQWPDLRQL